METTFQETRAHLGIETQRQWSDLAIQRTTPALLGLFSIVINAAMLALTSAIANAFDIGFHVDGFWTAVGGSIVITIVTWIVDGFVGED